MEKRAVKAPNREGFEALFRLSPIGIVVSSSLGPILEANAAALALLGLQRADVIGRTTAELGLLPTAIRDRALHSLRAQGLAQDLEFQLTLPSGIARDVSAAVHSVVMSGELRYATFFIDVTSGKRARECFRIAIESAPDATVIVDKTGRIVLANAQVERVFGYARGELVGEHVERLVPERYRRDHVGHRAGFFANPAGRPMRAQAELHGLRKNGAEFPAEISLNPLMTAEGPQVMAAVRDVTERRSMQTRLAFSDRLASVGTVAAGMAHEINNPLAFVLANLDLLAEGLREVEGGVPSERVQSMLELVGEAREGAERVRKIVRGMKIFTHMDEKRPELVDLPRVLEVAVSMASSEVRHRARLVKDYQPTPLVLSDESRLVQVFINLLVNAAQALPEGQAASNEIRLVLRTEGSRAVAEVRDTGRGIPPEMRARIFDPFFTTKPVGVGVGLGLAICHGIVAELGGEISVESEVNVGTTFRVVLPAARGDVMHEHTRAAPVASRPPRTGRVLVVDDDPAMGAALRRVLRDHEVTVVVSGKAALDLLLSGAAFDVILSDVMMPEMTGAELHAELMRRRPELCSRMVFMTAGPFTQSSQEFLDRVPNQRLEKPCDTEAVRALVHVMLP
jgi:PAS domain S-box-containing protein